MSSRVSVPLSHSKNNFDLVSPTGCTPPTVFEPAHFTTTLTPTPQLTRLSTNSAFPPQKVNTYAHPEVPTSILFQPFQPPPPLHTSSTYQDQDASLFPADAMHGMGTERDHDHSAGSQLHNSPISLTPHAIDTQSVVEPPVLIDLGGNDALPPCDITVTCWTARRQLTRHPPSHAAPKTQDVPLVTPNASSTCVSKCHTASTHWVFSNQRTQNTAMGCQVAEAARLTPYLTPQPLSKCPSCHPSLSK